MVGSQSAPAGFSRHRDRHRVGVCRAPADSGKGDRWNESRIGPLNSEQTLSGETALTAGTCSAPVETHGLSLMMTLELPVSPPAMVPAASQVVALCLRERACSIAGSENGRAAIQSGRGMACPAGRGVCRSDSTSRIRKVLKKRDDQFRPNLTAHGMATFPVPEVRKSWTFDCNVRPLVLT